MDIFESLENLNVSEECFDEIMGIVEELLSEDIPEILDKRREKRDTKERIAKSVIKSTKSPERVKKAESALKKIEDENDRDYERGEEYGRNQARQEKQKEEEGLKKGSLESVPSRHNVTLAKKTEEANKYYPKNMKKTPERLVPIDYSNSGREGATKRDIGDTMTRLRSEDSFSRKYNEDPSLFKIEDKIESPKEYYQRKIRQSIDRNKAKREKKNK